MRQLRLSPRRVKTAAGLVGEHLVLAELLRRAYVAMPAPAGMKDFDLVVLDPRRRDRATRVEVKTSFRDPIKQGLYGAHYHWPLRRTDEGRRGTDLVYCFVLCCSPAERAVFWLVPAAEVASYLRWDHRTFTERGGRENPMRVFRIPADDRVPRRGTCPPSWRDRPWRRWRENWGIFGRRTP
jgi:hypothetical protein